MSMENHSGREDRPRRAAHATPRTGAHAAPCGERRKAADRTNGTPRHGRHAAAPTSRAAAADKASKPARTGVAQKVTAEFDAAKKGRIALVAGIALVALLAVTVVSFMAKKQEGTTSFDSMVYCYYSGQRAEVEAPAKVEEKDGLWELTGQSDLTITLDARPLYEEGTDTAFFGDTAMVVLPSRQQILSLDAGSTLAVKDGGASVTSRLGKNVGIENGFIFDGLDTYVFLNEATVVTDSGETKISALSSVEAVYGSTTWVYDHESGQVLAFDDQSVTVKVDDGVCAYDVDVVNDTLQRGETSQLLLGTGAKLDSIFE